jgi:CHAT domain-containing protein
MLDEFVDGENEALNDSICRLLFPKNITTELKNYEYILLIPALNIGSFPLYALQPFEDKNNYLIDEISISLLHSLPNTIKRMKTSNIDFQSHNQALFYPTNPIVVGNPYFGKCQKSYPQIPGAEKEARFIANLYNMPILVGASASKGKVLKQFDQSDFMYFATHGISDASQPMDSGRIVLYDGGSSCDFLSAREIQALSISPECMVVLSACNTGLGKALDAGVIGLARSFMAKGAMNVVMSLWSVDDQATAELMELFALELKEEHPFFPSEHLRQAIIQYKEQNPNPAYWAAFITMGTPYPASLNMSMSSLGKKD